MRESIDLIDAHNHLQDVRFGALQAELISRMKDVGVTACIVNGTDPCDWPSVAQLAANHPKFVRPSFGLHPWKIANRPADWADRLRGLLLKFPSAGIGECGLDRWIEGHDIDDQLVVFKQQLKMACELDRPITIHCLKAWGHLVEVLQQAPHLPRFLLHAFAGSTEVANQIVRLGGYFSFSGYFLHPRKRTVVDTFREMPQDRILLETDAPYMLPPEAMRLENLFGSENPESPEEELNHPANLEKISTQFHRLIEVSSERVVENTNRWWFG